MSDDEKKISFDEGGFSFNLGGLSSGKIAIIFAAVSTVVGSDRKSTRLNSSHT